MVVVLPTPFTPTTKITYGLWLVGKSQSSAFSVLFSVKRAAISALNTLLSSEVETYLSRAMRSSMRSIIFTVVLTPTSDVISISSKLSKTSSSTFDFPAMARVIFEKTLCFVVSRPLSSTSFFFLLKSPKNPIIS